jgi:hypothetical protein
VRFNQSAPEHAIGWNQRDKDVIGYAVQQERERFSN